MFIIFISMEREHSNSPQYIFVFGDEVFNKINAIFLLPSKTKISPTHYKSIHPPEICPHLQPENILLPRSTHMKKKIEGHQMTSSNHTTPIGQL